MTLHTAVPLMHSSWSWFLPPLLLLHTSPSTQAGAGLRATPPLLRTEPQLSSNIVPHTSLQRLWLRHHARTDYLHARKAIMRVQAVWRGRNARATFEQTRHLHAVQSVQVREQIHFS